jgi:hypothetical protein
MSKRQSKPTEEDETPYLFLVEDGVALGTSRALAYSDNTLDIPFHELARNHDLQAAMGLMISGPKTSYGRPVKMGRRFIDRAARYLSTIKPGVGHKESERNRRYLANNGMVRVLIEDTALIEDLREKKQKQALNCSKN